MIAHGGLGAAGVLLALGVVGACKPASDAPRVNAVAPAQATDDSDAEDDGEVRAGIAATHRLGMPAPAMTLTTLDGAIIDLAKLYGEKPVYLKFWATWCTPCREQMPKFERIYETLGTRIHVIAVNAGLNDDAAAVRAFRDEYGLKMPIVVDDGSLAAALDLQVTPQHVLVGRDARIAYVGHLDGAKLDGAIASVLAQRPSGDSAAGQPVALRPAFRPGELVRDLRATLIDGTTIELGPTRDGRPRGLVLFADWCESYLETSQPKTSQACRRVREDVDRLVARGDIEWLGIGTGVWSSTQSLGEYGATTKTRIPLALDADGALFRAFGVREMPTVVLLDGKGRLARVIGPDERDLDAAVRIVQSLK